MIIPQYQMVRIEAGQQTALLQRGERPCWADWAPQPVRAGYKGKEIKARIVAVDQKSMGQLTEEDARRLGCPSLQELRWEWNRHHPKAKWHHNRLVWLVRFVYNGVPEEYAQTNLLDLLREVNESCGKA